MESAQGRKGVFVEFVGVFVGDIGCIIAEAVISMVMMWALFLSWGGETGLYRELIILLAALVAVEVMTVRGMGRWSATLVGAGFTTLTGGCITGLNPVEVAGWKTVVGAREMMGVFGIGNATLKRGRASAMGKLAGGERLSGEALGGVSGAYGMDTAGMLDMFRMEIGV